MYLYTWYNYKTCSVEQIELGLQTDNVSHRGIEKHVSLCSTNNPVQRKLTVFYVIDQTRGRVFHQDIQSPRSLLKNEAVGRVF